MGIEDLFKKGRGSGGSPGPSRGYDDYNSRGPRHDDSAWDKLPDAAPGPDVDLSQVLTNGLTGMDPAAKDALLKTFVEHHLKTGKGAASPEDRELRRRRQETDLEDKQRMGQVRFWGLSAGLVVLLCVVVLFVGLFAYVTLKNGVLNDGSVLTGLFSAVVDVLRILSNSGSGY